MTDIDFDNIPPGELFEFLYKYATDTRKEVFARIDDLTYRFEELEKAFVADQQHHLERAEAESREYRIRIVAARADAIQQGLDPNDIDQEGI